jgi:hypothetical protein
MRLRTTAVRNLRQISRSNKNRLRFIVLCAVRARHDLDRSLFRSTIESGRCEQSILLPRGCDASSLLSDAAKLRGALRRGPKRRKNRRCGDHSMVQEAPGAQSPINVKRAPLSCCPVMSHRVCLAARAARRLRTGVIQQMLCVKEEGPPRGVGGPSIVSLRSNRRASWGLGRGQRLDVKATPRAGRRSVSRAKNMPVGPIPDKRETVRG